MIAGRAARPIRLAIAGRSVRLLAALVSGATACGPTAEERADRSLVGAIVALGRADAKDVDGREKLLATLEHAEKGSPEGEGARTACVRYHRTLIDLRKTLIDLEREAPPGVDKIEPTLEVLTGLGLAEDLQKRAETELAPCIEATHALRVRTRFAEE